jgi:hypothetical protein
MYTEILLSRPVLGTIPNNVVTVSIPYVIWASEGTTRSLSVVYKGLFYFKLTKTK